MSEDLTKKLPQSDSEKLTLILSTVQSMERRLDRLEVRVDNIEARLQRLEQKVEERLQETRPIWEKLVVDISEVQQGQREIKTSLRDVSRRMSLFNDTLATIQVDYRDIYDRLRVLELSCNQPNSST
jgi:chromosome segregation ATPase